MKQTSVLIIRETPTTWTLQITCNIGTVNEFRTSRRFSRLVTAMDAANTLRMHIDNNDELPLNQYPKAG